jgi:hypothetical protein
MSRSLRETSKGGAGYDGNRIFTKVARYISVLMRRESTTEIEVCGVIRLSESRGKSAGDETSES